MAAHRTFYRSVTLLLLSFTLFHAHGQEMSLNILQAEDSFKPLYYFMKPHYDPMEISHINHFIQTGRRQIWDKPDSALFWLDSAFYKSRAISYARGMAEAEINKGLIAVGQGDFNQSFSHYLSAYKYIPFAENSDQLLTTLFINIGATYTHKAEYEKAAKYYYLTLQYAKDHSRRDYNMIIAYSNIADVFIRMEQYDQAEYYLNEGEALAVARNNLAALAYFLANRAELELAKKNYTAADSYYTKAAHYAKITNNIDVQQAVLVNRGRMMLELDKPQHTIELLNQALEMGTGSYPYYSIVGPYYMLGEALYKIGRLEEAEKVLLFALEKAQVVGIRADKLHALSLLSNIYQLSNRKDDELKLRREFIALQNILLNKEKFEAINQLEVKYRTAQKDKDLAEKQLLIAKQEREIEKNKIWVGATVISILVFAFLLIIFQKSNKQKQKIVQLRAMMEGEEKERERLARELHDGIGGMLAAIQMHCSAEVNRANSNMDHILKMLEDTSEEVRKTSHNLMPEIIQRFDLEDALLLYCQNINNTNKSLKIDLQVLSPLPPLISSVKLSTYRMVQEAVQNIIKHAHATFAMIQISFMNKKIHLLLEDNGIGFNPQKVKRGLGLSNLVARVNALQGNISIESQPGNGTTIGIEIPQGKLL